jgi:hypothetical protein
MPSTDLTRTSGCGGGRVRRQSRLEPCSRLGRAMAARGKKSAPCSSTYSKRLSHRTMLGVSAESEPLPPWNDRYVAAGMPRNWHPKRGVRVFNPSAPRAVDRPVLNPARRVLDRRDGGLLVDDVLVRVECGGMHCGRRCRRRLAWRAVTVGTRMAPTLEWPCDRCGATWRPSYKALKAEARQAAQLAARERVVRLPLR